VQKESFTVDIIHASHPVQEEYRRRSGE